MASLYVLSGLILLAVPVLQIRLHRRLAGANAGGMAWLGRQNHLLLLLAALAAAGVYILVNPEANIRVDLLLAIPLAALVILLWGAFLLRLAHWRR